jgi:hypothetical protein
MKIKQDNARLAILLLIILLNEANTEGFFYQLSIVIFASPYFSFSLFFFLFRFTFPSKTNKSLVSLLPGTYRHSRIAAPFKQNFVGKSTVYEVFLIAWFL